MIVISMDSFNGFDGRNDNFSLNLLIEMNYKDRVDKNKKV
jgi:hypothetical protein